MSDASRSTPAGPDGWRGLLGDVVREGRKVVEQEAQSARSEWQERNRITKEAVGMVIGIVVCATLGLGLLSAAAVIGLASVIPSALAALVVGALWLGLGAVLLGVLRSSERRADEDRAASR